VALISTKQVDVPEGSVTSVQLLNIVEGQDCEDLVLEALSASKDVVFDRVAITRLLEDRASLSHENVAAILSQLWP
jgi:hypothetical protein